MDMDIHFILWAIIQYSHLLLQLMEILPLGTPSSRLLFPINTAHQVLKTSLLPVFIRYCRLILHFLPQIWNQLFFQWTLILFVGKIVFRNKDPDCCFLGIIEALPAHRARKYCYGRYTSTCTHLC